MCGTVYLVVIRMNMVSACNIKCSNLLYSVSHSLPSWLAGGPLLRVARIRRTTDTFLFISHTTNVLLFKFRCNIFIDVIIIKEMPGSVASGTPCICMHEFGSACLKHVPVILSCSFGTAFTLRPMGLGLQYCFFCAFLLNYKFIHNSNNNSNHNKFLQT